MAETRVDECRVVLCQDRLSVAAFVYLHFTMEDNLTLTEEKKEMYRTSFVGMFYRRYIDGLWVAAEGVIYEMWNDAKNTFDAADMPRGYRDEFRHYVAVDYGMQNPTVFLDAWDDDRTFWITNEYYWDSRAEKRQKTDSEYADDLEKFIDYDDSAVIIVDPSAASFILEMKNRGYRVKPADNAVIDGIRITSTMIYNGWLRVEKNDCPKFRKERETYVWNEKAASRGEEEPVKERDHAMDAMRYLVKTIVTRGRLKREQKQPA